MYRIFALRLACIFVLACLLNGSRLSADSNERPNFVIFLSDDMGWDQPGFQGGKKVLTPNLDRIAGEGVRLTQFYVQSVCSPTRAALMTGRYPFRNGMEERSHGIDVGGMLPDERTLPQTLQSAGYSTAIFGKWHLGAWYKHHLPMQRGFEHQFGFYGALIDSFSHRREQTFDWHRNEALLDQPGYSTFLIADEFSNVLAKRDRTKPFFYYVAFNAVHGPHGAPPEYVDKYRGDLQLAMLECMDVAIGQMLAKLESEGVLDKTLIVYFNDNGGPKRIVANGPYRGYKGDTYEGGVRVPCAMRWPQHLMANSTCDEMLHVVDLYPTLVKLAGGSLVQPLPLDGRDAWPSIAHGEPSPHSEIVLSVPGLESSETGPPAIRVGDFKLVGDELYNIKLDPYEKMDIAAHHSDRVQAMKDRLASLAAERRPPEAHGRPSDIGSLVLGQLESQAPIPDWLQKQNEKLAQDPQPTKRDRKKSKRKTVPLTK